MATRTIRQHDDTGRPGLTSKRVWRAVAAARARVPVMANGGAP
jgi:hypothetical protein